MRRTLFFAIIASLIFVSCIKKADRKILTDQNILHQNMKQLTEVIIQDMFSPPVSSRIYCYTSLAAYEVIKFDKPNYNSLTDQLNGFGPMPVPEKNKSYNFLLAATKAFFIVAETITFSRDSLIQYENKIYSQFEALLDKEIYDRSISFGDSIGKTILKRAANDNYKETRGMPKFLGSNEPGKWRPTPTDYLDALEPNWEMIKVLAVNSDQAECPAPPAFSTDTTSEFLNTIKEVMLTIQHLKDHKKQLQRSWMINLL